MKKDVKSAVVATWSDGNNKLILLLLIVIVIMGIMTIVFYFSAPPPSRYSEVEITVPQPQLTAQGAVSLQIINPPAESQNSQND